MLYLFVDTIVDFHTINQYDILIGKQNNFMCNKGHLIFDIYILYVVKAFTTLD